MGQLGRVLLAVLALALAGCVADTGGIGGTRLLANKAGAGGRSAVEIFQDALNSPVSQRTRLGTDEFLGQGTGGRSTGEIYGVSDTGEISLNLVNVPIPEAARAVLGEALGKTYNIDDGVTGTVTLQTTRQLAIQCSQELVDWIISL